MEGSLGLLGALHRIPFDLRLFIFQSNQYRFSVLILAVQFARKVGQHWYVVRSVQYVKAIKFLKVSVHGFEFRDVPFDGQLDVAL